MENKAHMEATKPSIHHWKRDRKGNEVCLVRNVPKRDKSISARQWKKRQKAQRREAKKVA